MGRTKFTVIKSRGSSWRNIGTRGDLPPDEQQARSYPMPIPSLLEGRLSLPVIGSPMFLVSQPELVIAQCKAGIVGSFPALNARPQSLLEEWIVRIKGELAAFAAANPDLPVAPFAVNQIVHRSNQRLQEDVEVCVRHEVPITITSLQPPADIVKAAHGYGGIVFHDVVSVRHAEKALEQGVDGLILVSAGAGGHAGTINPFALVSEIRRFYNGPIILSGAIANGASILAAQSAGADLAYMGTRFIATQEADAPEAYKQMLVQSSAKDILYSPYFSGVHANYLIPSIVAAGYDPANLPAPDPEGLKIGSKTDKKAWRDIWGAGQGLGSITDIPSVAECVRRLSAEYQTAADSLVRRRFKSPAF
jgi:nitronate monooxygenase